MTDVERITPACAGKSWHIVVAALPAEDHPRVCGEKFNNPEFGEIRTGSPPRVRGKD